jgi:hypothetical protein
MFVQAVLHAIIREGFGGVSIMVHKVLKLFSLYKNLKIKMRIGVDDSHWRYFP